VNEKRYLVCIRLARRDDYSRMAVQFSGKNTYRPYEFLVEGDTDSLEQDVVILKGIEKAVTMFRKDAEHAFAKEHP